MSGATFHGMSPWKTDAGIVECDDTELGLVDLHNVCDVQDMRVAPSAGGSLSVRLTFRHGPTAREFALSFDAVSGFSATQLDYHPDDVRLFHDLSHVSNGSGRSTLEIVLAPVRLEFQTSKVRFEPL